MRKDKALDQHREVVTALRRYNAALATALGEHPQRVEALDLDGTRENQLRGLADSLADKLGLGDRFRGLWPEEGAKSLQDTLPVDILNEFFRARHSAVGFTLDAVALGEVMLAIDKRMREIFATDLVNADRAGLEEEWTSLWVDFRLVSAKFWESVATASLRLCAAYDRTAQLLAFIFFNVRKFDRDTYSGVIGQLTTNYAQEEQLFREQHGWRQIRATMAEVEALHSRRNALTHSSTLRAGVWHPSATAAPVASTALERMRSKAVQQRAPDEEMTRLVKHCDTLSVVQLAALDLCHFGLGTLKLSPLLFPPR
ncbi:MAG: hypothetical protein HZA61_09890 [Candidatus Eisenbacteria bacterium]|uniref:Uncharacterized protein n=1 Tax=Eiseniibacteriota bacterium TaxID=2212470 RepID=A0A933SC32_UNCEI|nr:hypothetical protein [Candidatus Eisenbacteria bacterium]